MTIDEIRLRVRQVVNTEFGASLEDEVNLIIDNEIKAYVNELIRDRLRSIIRKVIDEDGGVIKDKIFAAIRNL